MKKSYLMIAAAAAMLAACSSNDTFKEVDVQESAISFTPYAGIVSKGAIEGADYAARKASLATAGGFVVYGYKTTDLTNSAWSTLNQTVFNGVNVTSSDDGTTWTYSPKRFWDKNGKYSFYAVAPYNSSINSNYSINVSSCTSGDANYDANYNLNNKKFGYINIANVASNKSTDSYDFLLARTDAAHNVLGSNHTNSSNPTVNFQFHHVMAKVTFALKSTLVANNAKIEVTSLAMSGWDNATATFHQETFTNPTTATDVTEWTLATPAVPGNCTLIGTGGDTSPVIIPCGGNSATATNLTTWWIMVPQAIEANTLTFTLSYTYKEIDDKGTPETNDDVITYEETFANQVATVENAQTWGTDSYIKYTIDVKPAAIEFDIQSICNFDNNGDEVVADID